MNIGITGIKGLIGWHLRAFLYGLPEVEIVEGDKFTFAEDSRLLDFVSACDAIVHLAGMNRGKDEEVESTNLKLATALIDACERQNLSPHIIFSSSTHIYQDTAYGRSKLLCAQIFQDWAFRNGAIFTNLILPHVFGECGKPFYNSVVSTFCFQVANGQEPQIDKDGSLELIHTQEVARKILELIQSKQEGELVIPGIPVTVREMLARVRTLADYYDNHMIPDLREPLDLNLFNTYRSYLYPKFFPRILELHKDNRGELFEACKSLNGGQTFLSTTRPGITRGNHFHLNKVERFLVVRGEANIRIRKMFDDEILEFRVSGSKPQYIDIPTLHTHSITNTGNEDLLTLFWAHEIFDPKSTDTKAAPV